MWTLGCVMAELLTGNKLFPGDGIDELLYKIFDLLGTLGERESRGLPSVRRDTRYRHSNGERTNGCASYSPRSCCPRKGSRSSRGSSRAIHPGGWMLPPRSGFRGSRTPAACRLPLFRRLAL